MSRRVVITGMGCVSPVGNSLEEAWGNLIQGNSGIEIIPEWVEARYNDRPAVHVGDRVQYDPKDWITPAKTFGVWISSSILQSPRVSKHGKIQACLSDSARRCVRTGGIIGVGLGGIITLLNEYERFVHGGAKKVSAFMIPGIIGNPAPGHCDTHSPKSPTGTSIGLFVGAHGIGESFQHIGTVVQT